MQVASAAGLQQVWTSQGIADRFDLPLRELVSTIADCLQHVGQAAYAVGLRPE